VYYVGLLCTLCTIIIIIMENLEKDLGVVFSSDLKVGTQCREAYSKASQSLGLIPRVIKYRNPSILPLYKYLVRPHLE